MDIINFLMALRRAYQRDMNRAPTRILCHPEMERYLKTSVDVMPIGPDYSILQIMGMVLVTKPDMWPGCIIVCTEAEESVYPKVTKREIPYGMEYFLESAAR